MKKHLLLIILLLLITPTLVNAENNYLYDVLKDEAENNGLAREYTGEHHDSFTKEPTHKIYHWYAENDEEGNQVLEKDNVIFGGFCWKVLRTTDTGGVKIVYNGISSSDNKCNNNDSRIAYSSFNTNINNYTYNYGTSYTYDETNNKFTLTGNIESIKYSNNFNEIKDKYTCLNTGNECNRLYIVKKEYKEQNYVQFIALEKSSYIKTSIGNGNYNFGENAFHGTGYLHTDKKPYIKSASLSVDDQLYRTTSINKNGSYYVSTSVNWNSSTKKWELVNPTLVNGTSYYSLKNKYTFSDSTTTSGSEVTYIIDVDSYYYEYIKLKEGEDITSENYTLYYGNSYVDNNDGTYTINNPSTVKRFTLPTNYNLIKQKYVCINAVDNTCNEVWYVSNTNDMWVFYSTSANKYKYATDYTYENGTYRLSDDSVYFWNINNQSEKDKINIRHYTCLNLTGECSELAYVFSTSYGIAYVLLKNNEQIEDVFNDMMNSNVEDSSAKSLVDYWYEQNLINNKDYLEDTVFCNNRSLKNNYTWTRTTNSNVYPTVDEDFGEDLLKCPRDYDRLSVNNPNAKLKYPIALLTKQELLLSNNKIPNKSSSSSWLLTPESYGANVCQKLLYSSGDFNSCSNVRNTYELRPVVSLKKGISIASGTGSIEDPYILNDLYNAINVEIVNETEDLTVEISNLSQVEEGEEVNFKVTPIKGHKLTSIRIIDEDNNEIEYTTTDNKNYTFIMPAEDVTIIPSYERVKNGVFVEDNKNTKEFVIEVNDSRAVLYEDTVRFRVDPEEGYEVDTIDITDEEQNKIDYKKTNIINEYEFTMPDTNVLIKPYYRLINQNNLPNPNTKRQIILILISVLVLGIMTIIFVKKKKRLN